MQSFTNKFINDYKQLSHAVIGFEFEFYTKHTYIKILELLNLEFNPIKVYAFEKYHSNFIPSDTEWKIEPDLSGGSNMIELVTGQYDFITARIILAKILNFIQREGYTDNLCSLHLNISFDDMDIKQLNTLKFIVNYDEEFIYNKFPLRRNNIYCKSIKYIIPFDDYNDSELAFKTIVNSLHITDDAKYYGVNFQKLAKGYIECRYIGGEKYETKFDAICEVMNYTVMSLRNSITNELNDADIIKIQALIDDNLNWNKSFLTYKDFLSNSNNIKIEVDMSDDYEYVSNSWPKFNKAINYLLKNTTNLDNIKINCNNDGGGIELIGGKVVDGFSLSKIDFIECELDNCIILKCNVIDGKVDNSHIYSSTIHNSIINNTKLENCKVYDQSVLTNVYFNGGILDSKFVSGVFRSGVIDENGVIEKDVRRASDDGFWKFPIGDKKDKLKK